MCSKRLAGQYQATLSLCACLYLFEFEVHCVMCAMRTECGVSACQVCCDRAHLAVCCNFFHADTRFGRHLCKLFVATCRGCLLISVRLCGDVVARAV